MSLGDSVILRIFQIDPDDPVVSKSMSIQRKQLNLSFLLY